MFSMHKSCVCRGCSKRIQTPEDALQESFDKYDFDVGFPMNSADYLGAGNSEGMTFDQYLHIPEKPMNVKCRVDDFATNFKFYEILDFTQSLLANKECLLIVIEGIKYVVDYIQDCDDNWEMINNHIIQCPENEMNGIQKLIETVVMTIRKWKSDPHIMLELYNMLQFVLNILPSEVELWHVGNSLGELQNILNFFKSLQLLPA